MNDKIVVIALGCTLVLGVLSIVILWKLLIYIIGTISRTISKNVGIGTQESIVQNTSNSAVIAQQSAKEKILEEYQVKMKNRRYEKSKKN
jgi:hypothetical protein